MRDVLIQIMAERRRDVAAAKRRVSWRRLLLEADQRPRHSLANRLRTQPAPRIIAEIKRASPSAGALRADLDPATVARAYARAGAVGISVLTEPRHFQGSERDLRAARAAVGLPILRKDFTGHPYHLAEAAAWGADVVLLIAAGLEPNLCRALHLAAFEVGLETIVEIHTIDELDVALACDGAIIGVNSRNLKTLKPEPEVVRQLIGAIPSERLRIAESGIRSRAEVIELQALGYDGLLIGETLLRSRSPGRKLRELAGT
jgi:indole-3-glycerol phosphate synthase